MGAFGAAIVPDEARVLTHCNAGALATAGYGTALGVIRGAVEQGKHVVVFADETRPFFQGARLTAWELVRDGIQTTVITDNMTASLMQQGKVDLVVVGADRIAANGDTANKIGTYGVAVLAREHTIPFYVAAPLSTIDLNTPDGEHIPIEERNAREVTHVGSSQVAPKGALIWNPAFDITPHRFIAGIITERGILRAPYAESLKQAFEDVRVTAGSACVSSASKPPATRPPPPSSMKPATPRSRGRFARTSSPRRCRFTANGAASCPSSPRGNTSATSAASSSAPSARRRRAGRTLARSR